jgi:hypothetical protein
MPFLSKLRVEEADATGRRWRFSDVLHYVGRYISVTIPIGYVTDWATVPRLMWPIVPPTGKYNKATGVHDYLITEFLDKGLPDVTSAQVDAEFRHAMRDCGVRLTLRWVMWAGVRWAAPFTKSRRSWGWFKTLPALLGVSAAALAPVVVPLVLLLKG